MMARGYTLDLYCDATGDDIDGGVNHFQLSYASFFGRTFPECKRKAVRRGWKFEQGDTHLCPSCGQRQPAGRALVAEVAAK